MKTDKERNVTREEFLMARYGEMAERYVSKHMKFFLNPSLQRINPFIAPNSWQDFLSDMKTKIKTVMANNEALETQMRELGIGS